jgi:hypothetical protein
MDEGLRAIILIPETRYSYELWMRGRRRLHLWGRREADMFLGNIGKNGQNDHLRPEQRDHPLAGAN